MITIHVGSLVFGMIIGLIAGGALILGITFADNGLWGKGFGEGWESGRKACTNEIVESNLKEAKNDI